MTFEEYYKKYGLEEYPFSIYNSEQEKKEGLFIKPSNYSLLEDSFKNGLTAIIVGNRGSGKTKILEDLKKKADRKMIICVLDNYEKVASTDNITDFYTLFLENIVKSLLPELFSNKKLIKKLSNDNKILLSYLITRFGNNLTEKQIASQIDDVQLSFFKQLLNQFSKPITAVLNYFATATTNLGNKFLTETFGRYLPPINEENIKSIFPNIKYESDTCFFDIDVSYDLFDRTLDLVKSMEYDSTLIFLDKLDEDKRFENDSDEIVNFISSILLDSKLLLNPKIQLVFSVWSIPFSGLSSKFRRQKNYVYTIDWNSHELETVLNRRLSVYSNQKINTYTDLFCENVTGENIQEIFKLCNANPRDLWHIFHNLFDTQYSINPNNKISNEAIIKGLEKFVVNFDFYEYYPRKKGARRNTNDIYSYIQHLLKLTEQDFTNSELKSSASTGGSTTNYITAMCTLGLTKKTSKKRNGSVIYEICDPKVIYAIKNHLAIENI